MKRVLWFVVPVGIGIVISRYCNPENFLGGFAGGFAFGAVVAWQVYSLSIGKRERRLRRLRRDIEKSARKIKKLSDMKEGAAMLFESKIIIGKIAEYIRKYKGDNKQSIEKMLRFEETPDELYDFLLEIKSDLN
ncbi:MAG: hypothetical protein A2017_06495 [Lentisphaerae bacterium GWF2_44_16]|nr:MAG: hypothetical protein A2017_06495 [Lentisphaerae bacterium GWF2_44_16]